MEHPADLCLEINGRDVSDLCCNAAKALYATMGLAQRGAGESGSPADTVCVTGHDCAELLVFLLGDLLYAAVEERRLLHVVSAEVRRGEACGGHMELCVRGLWTFAGSRHLALCREIKAVTHHDAVVRRQGVGGYVARVVLDL